MGIAELEQLPVPSAKESLKKNSDPRLMGALWLISRRIAKKTELLLVREPSNKAEVSAGLSGTFTPANEERWGILGGGRQVAETGAQETIGETLRRELEEEVGDLLFKIDSVITREAIEALYKWSVENVAQQLVYPFLVGQLVTRELESGVTAVVGINEIAASVAEVHWEELPLEVRMDVQRVIKGKEADWFSLQKLESNFDQAVAWGGESVTVQGMKVRPQVLTAAKILSLQQKESSEEIAFKIQRWNRQVKRYISHEAKKQNVKVRNGAIGEWGTPKNDLAQSDYEFLKALPIKK